MSTTLTETPSVSIEAAMQQTPPKIEPKLVIFAWSGELDKIWPTLILATTSAAMGQETTVGRPVDELKGIEARLDDDVGGAQHDTIRAFVDRPRPGIGAADDVAEALRRG